MKTESSLYQLTLVRFREFLREPEALFWTFIFPVLISAGLGIAFRNKPADILHVGTTSPEIAAQLRTEKGLAVDVVERGPGDEALRLGKILLMVLPDSKAGVIYRYDNLNPDGRSGRLLVERTLARAAGSSGPPASEEIVSEPGSRYIDFLLPGLLGMNLLGSGVWGLGFAMVDARRRKLLKRLVASPMSKAEYLLSFVLSRLLMLFIEVGFLVGFGYLVFGVPVRGPVWQLLALCILGALAFSSLGLLIASRAQTIEAVSGLMNFIMLPMWIFSGVFFSSERFPAFLQPFIKALPLTAVIDALRGNMLQGQHLHQLWPQIAILLGWMGITFFTALKLFRWR